MILENCMKTPTNTCTIISWLHSLTSQWLSAGCPIIFLNGSRKQYICTKYTGYFVADKLKSVDIKGLVKSIIKCLILESLC